MTIETMIYNRNICALIFFLGITATVVTAQQSAQNHDNSRMHETSQMVFYGDWINIGFFNQNLGTSYFYGAKSQSITGTNDVDFEYLVLRNPNGLQIKVPVSISKQLTFTNGTITTPRATPSVSVAFLDDATYATPAATRHINGYCSKIGNDSFYFPIGDGKQLRPAAISKPVRENTVFRAAYFKTNPSVATLPIGAPFPTNQFEAGILKVSNVEYWDVDGSTPARITLTWNAASLIDNLTTNGFSELVVVGWNGRQWVNLGNEGKIGNFSAGYVTSKIVVPNDFQAFTLAAARSAQRCISSVEPLSLGSDRSICLGTTTVLRATAGYSRYLWSNGAASSSINISTAGKYWVMAWDTCGNVQTDSVQIQTLARPTLTVQNPICHGRNDGKVILSDASGVRTWLNGTPQYPRDLEHIAGGVYTFRLETAAGCTFDTTITIVEPPQPIIKISGKDTLHAQIGKPFILSSTAGNGFNPITYEWSPPGVVKNPSAKTTEVEVTGRTLITLIATDAKGCDAVDAIEVFIDRPSGLYIPNAFKPEKEIYTVFGDQTVSKIRYMRIFDRWGELVYEGLNFKPDGSTGWDGDFRGKEMNTGTFVVTLEVLFANGEIKRFATDLLLTR